PILLRIKPDRSDALSPTFSIGPSLGFELSRSLDAGVFSTVGTSASNGPDLGLVLGIGVEKPHGNSRLTFDARTTIGLTNIETSSYQTHGIRNVSLVTMLGYGFSLGGP